MDKQSIILQPQIIQFTNQHKQLLKITNRTNQLIQNCFFCLFNTNKYQFTPDTFSLQPKQHKLITICYKLKNVQNNNSKQFAYLKSKNISKRITLCHNMENISVEKQKYQYTGFQDINTFTSRDYKQIQKTAYQKIISQKQAYIAKLQKKIQENVHNFQHSQQQILEHNNKIYLDQIHQLQLKLALLNKEKQQLIKQNIEINGKFKQYRIIMETDSRVAQLNLKLLENKKENQSQGEEIRFLEVQCEEFLRKIQEKQMKNKDLQFLYASKIDGIIKQGQKKLQQLQNKIHQQRKNAQKILKQQLTQQTNKLNKQIKSLQQQLSEKQKQIKSYHQSRIQQQKKIQIQNQNTNKKLMKIQLQKQSLVLQNKQYKDKFNNLEQSFSMLKQQSLTHRNKLDDQGASTQKLRQYLQVALQSSKNQNQILKTTKAQLQKSLEDQVKLRKNYENKNNNLQQQVRDLQKQMKQLQQQKLKLNQYIRTQQQQTHDKIMELKSENIDLLQKINIEKKKQNQKDQQLEKAADKMRDMEKQLGKIKGQFQVLEKKYTQVAEEKQKLDKKVQKYRKQVRKSRNSISENAREQLKIIEQQKNKLAKKIEQLEVSVQKTQGNHIEARHKTRTHHEQVHPQIQTHSYQNIQSKYPMSVEGDRRIGIKNQRRQLQQSQINSRSQIDMDKIYGQLGQLRQFRNYVNNQIKKLNHLYGIGQSSRIPNQNNNSIFSVINFFKDLQQKLQNKFGSSQKLAQAQKQIEFLKGRLTQLQPIVKTLKSRQKKSQQLSVSLNRQPIDRNAIQYIRQEMKNQYKKLYDALKLSQQKYEILRKKIYEQYRARIIQLISKKDRDQYTINKIQAVLQRFVEGLGNTSHKQAVLAKQVKLKHQAKKQVNLLKQKLTALNKQMQSTHNKKGTTCIRQPIKFQIQNDNDWVDGVKLQAKMLTYQAQNARLLAQKTLYTDKITQICDQLKLCESDLQQKQHQIQKLKKQVIEITKQNELQIIKQQQQLNTFKKKFIALQKMQKQIQDLQIKQKQNVHLRQQIQEKRQIIKNMRDKQKIMEQLLDQSRRNQNTLKDRQKKQYMQQSRMQQSLKDLKQNNRQLRSQNTKLREQVDSLVQQINKKNATLKRLKSQTQQHRIKTVKPQADSLQKLKTQISSLKQQLKKSKQQLQKQKNKKTRQISQKISEIQKIKSQCGIQKNILESIIRSLMDTIKGIYFSLDVLARKKGKIMGEQPNFDQMMNKMGEIKSVKIRQAFDQVIQALKQ